jgi:hypothetical protein
MSCGVLVILALGAASPLGAAPRVDFDGDGFADLAVGVPDEDVGNAVDAGAVNILYGSEDGLTVARNRFFTQATWGVPGWRQAGAQFGKALAAGDFNGDGFTDLAVGAPGFDLPFLPDGGMVVLFYGGEEGLSPSRSSFLVWLSVLDRNSAFGSALAAGDFDGDGFADLAVGAPEAIRDVRNTPGSGRGAAVVWYGSRFGMERRQVWLQGRNGLDETDEYRDQFGAALATGDFNCDGAADLAIGAPGEEGVDGLPIGAVSVIYGSAAGLTAAGNQVWSQHSDGAGNEAEDGDRYGAVLGRGDFNADGCDELLVGAPGDHTVHAIRGSPDGLVSDLTDEVGGTLPDFVSADFNRDGVEDLAIRLGGPDGGLHILFGDPEFGLPPLGSADVHLAEFRMPGLNSDDPSQKGTARTGHALAADEFYGDGLVALAVGIPDYDVLYKHNLLQIPDAGAIAIFRAIDIAAGIAATTAVIQFSPELDSFEGYDTSLHEVGGLAEADDHVGTVFAR